MYQPLLQEIYIERCKPKPRPCTTWEKGLKLRNTSKAQFGYKVQPKQDTKQNLGVFQYRGGAAMPVRLLQCNSNTSLEGIDLNYQDQRYRKMKTSLTESGAFVEISGPETSEINATLKNSAFEEINSNKPRDVLPNAIDNYTLFSDCGCLYTGTDNTQNDLSGKDSVNADYSNFYSCTQSKLHYVPEPGALKFVCPSKDSIHGYRIEKLREKMMATLDEIQSLTNNVPMPDGVEDLKRRQQRAVEFSARFSRNYLYHLQRQINDIKKMLRSTHYSNEDAHLIISQKMVTAHQSACQALQAYLHHLPCSVQRGVPDKLQELLLVVKDLCRCSELGVTNEKEGNGAVDIVEERCNNILQEIESIDWHENEICRCASSKSLKKIPKKEGKKCAVKNGPSNFKDIYLKPARIYGQKPWCISKGSKNRNVNISKGNKGILKTNVAHSKQPVNTRNLSADSKASSPKKKNNNNNRKFYDGDDIPTMMEYFPVEHGRSKAEH